MPTQSDWTAAAALLPDAQLCSCGDSPLSGQQLYRSYQMWGALTGSGGGDTPPTTSVWVETDVVALLLSHLPPAFNPGFYIQVNQTADMAWIMINLGQGLGNPILQVPAMQNTIFIDPSDPQFAQFDIFKDGDSVPWCTWSSNGLANRSGSTDIVVIP